MPNWHLPEARLALRRLRRQPAASVAAIVTLGTAFAAALATWILIDSVLLTPVPAAVDPDRLVMVQERSMNRDGTPGRLAQHLLFSRLAPLRTSHAFTEVAAIGRHPALVGDPARPISRDIAFVTPNFFQTLGVPVFRGRDIVAGDDREGAPVVAVITYRFWQTEFQEDPGVLGRVIRVGNTTATIVGIAPAGFRGINLTDTPVMFVPVHTAYDVLGRGMDYLHVGLPRTSPGLHVRSRRAAADLAGDIRRIVERIDGRVAPSEFLTLRDLIARQMASQQFGAAVLGALASVALLLTLLGTYVIAETMAKARERELGVRAALGATTRHLSGLIAGESAALVGLGLLAGLGLTWLASSTVEALLYQTEPFDLPAVGGAVVAVLVLALIVSARPALKAARLDIAALLRD